jgi:hypothetical protein
MEPSLQRLDRRAERRSLRRVATVLLFFEPE